MDFFVLYIRHLGKVEGKVFPIKLYYTAPELLTVLDTRVFDICFVSYKK